MPALALVLMATCVSATEVTWSFDDGDQLTRSANLRDLFVAGGLASGIAQWDPYLFLPLPKGGLDAARLTRLTVRLYSSAPADQLAVYYACADGRWSLGHGPAVQAGWAVYRLDLTRLDYRDSSPLPDSRQWGGTSKRVNQLRIDPGNQAGRWIALDYLRLDPPGDEPFAVGAFPEATGDGKLVRVEAPAEVRAGDELKVSVTAGLEAPAGEQTAVIWLLGDGGEIGATALRRVPVGTGTVTWSATFPQGTYQPPGTWRVQAALLETRLAGAGFGTDLATVKLTNPRAGTVRPPAVVISDVGGPVPSVDGRRLTPFFTVLRGASADLQRREMGAAGMHLFCDWFGTSGASDIGHVAPDRYDYLEYDRYFTAALAADPDALFLPHIGITPPMWWQQAHPEELCLYADGGHGPQSFTSERWRREIGDDLRRLLAHLQSSPYADRILGYCLFSGYSAEWQSWGLWYDHLADYSQPALAAWRRWLTARYRTDAGLRAAWRRPDATLAGAALPTAAERHQSPWGALRDPDREQPVIDFYRFLADCTAEAILDFARVAKEATGGRSLVGTYYGYLTEHNVRQQDSSHLALARVLASKDIDFLMSPPLYTGRNLGGTTGFMSAVESVQLHGKLWLSEADYRTHQTPPGIGYGRVDTLEQSQAVLLREMGHVLTHRTGVSWFDMDGGWLRGPDLVGWLARLRELHHQAIATRSPWHGELAVVVDEASFTYTTAMHPVNRSLSLDVIAEMPRVGVSWGFYLLDDVVSGAAPPHRAYLFLNAFRVTAAQRAALRARLEREGATAVWVYAPGCYSDEGVGVAGMRALTGFELQRQDGARALKVISSNGRERAGSDQPVTPWFAVTDGEAEALGTVAATELVGLARKRVGRWTSVFCAAPPPRVDLLRELAAQAGCHVYCETGDAISVDDRYLCLHAATDGDKTVRFPTGVELVDALSGEALGTSARALTLPMRRGETRLVRMGESR